MTTVQIVPIELQPNDAELLRHCLYQGMEAKYMELVKWTPESKQYRDNVSKKISGIFSILPSLTDNDVLIDPKFYKKANSYIGGANRFSILVEGKRVVVTCDSEKTRWHTKGQSLDWQPQVFLDGMEVTCLTKPTLSSQNQTHLNNILEWDYGICKRRLRIIEGAFFEGYIFEQDPKGDIEIRSDAVGDLVPEAYWAKDAEGVPLKMQTESGIKRITASEFTGKAYPVEVDDSDTFYSTTKDGYVYNLGTVWATVRGAVTGIAAVDSGASANHAMSAIFLSPNYFVYRSFFYFLTSEIEVGSTVTAATFSLYGYLLHGSFVIAQKGTQASTLTTADFDSFTGDLLVDSAVDWAVSTYNDLVFNAAGWAAVVKDGTTLLCAREYAKDYVGGTPTDAVYANGCYYANQGNTTYDPKLAVTWTTGGVTHYGAATLSGIGTLAGISHAIFIGKSTLSGAGTLAAIGVRIRTGLATLSGVGSLSAIGQRIRYGVSTLTGTGTLVANGVVTVIGKATLAGAGTLASSAVVTAIGKATLSGVGTLSAIGRRIFAGVATLAGTGSLAGVGRITAVGKATLSGAGTLSAIGRRIFTGIATLAGSGTLTSIGHITAIGKATLSGVGTLSAAWTRIRTGAATLTGQGTLAGKGVITAIGKATLSGVGGLAAIGTVITGGIIHYGSAILTGVGTLASAGHIIAVGKATLAGVGSLKITIHRAILAAVYFYARSFGVTFLGKDFGVTFHDRDFDVTFPDRDADVVFPDHDKDVQFGVK